MGVGENRGHCFGAGGCRPYTVGVRQSRLTIGVGPSLTRGSGRGVGQDERLDSTRVIEGESCENVGAGAGSEPDHAPQTEMLHHALHLVAQTLHRRIGETGVELEMIRGLFYLSTATYAFFVRDGIIQPGWVVSSSSLSSSLSSSFFPRWRQEPAQDG